MAEYESQKIRGWRSRLEDAATNARQKVHAAPAWVVYIEGIESCSSDQLPGSTKWFNRVFGPERGLASSELQEIQRIKRQIRKEEMTHEQVEALRAQWRQRYHRRRSRQTEDERRTQLEKKRIKRAARTPEEIELERLWFREWRTRQTSAWRDLQNANANRRRAANPELYRAINRRCHARTKDAKNERKRERRLANLDEIRRQERAYYESNRERIAAYQKAWRAKARSQGKAAT
jgi:hypothetical protein